MRTRADTTPTSRRVLLVYLAALVGREPNGLLEVRWRRDIGMKRRVYRVADQLAAAGEAIQRLGARTDVYVGCAPRRQRAGGLAAIGRVWVLWVDCDTPRAISHIDLQRMRREQLRDARFAHAGAYLYAGRVLAELGAAASVAERELRLTEALQHIQQHCHTAYAAITTVDRD